jgi:hypothetical protein
MIQPKAIRIMSWLPGSQAGMPKAAASIKLLIPQ